MTMEKSSATIERTLQNRRSARSVQMLSGMIAGIVADGQLQDLEIQFLNTWLTENNEITTTWPGSAVAKHLQEILSDGVITPQERAHFLKVLQDMVGCDFAETGASTAEVSALPFDHDHAPTFQAKHVCLTGEFLYGTRTACEAVSLKIGAFPVPNVSRKVSYLIVGTNVSPNWLTTSYGRKIMSAAQLRDDGHPIWIIPERAWFQALT